MRSPQILKPKNARLLVIGGSGLLGTLMRRAWPGGTQAIWQARREDAFATTGGPSVVFDPLADPEAFCAAARASDVILNLAGTTAGDAAQLARNTPLALAAQAAGQAAGGRPVIFASSAAVYGAGRPGLPCHEDDPLTPLAPYGATKAAMEAAITAHAAAHRPSAPDAAASATVHANVILRIGNVLGADALFGRARANRERVLDIFPDGAAPQRSFIGPQAFARAVERLARLAAAGADLPAVLNLAQPGTVGMDALLRAANEGWTARPAPANALPRLELDVARAVNLGLVPEAPARAAPLLADLATLLAPPPGPRP